MTSTHSPKRRIGASVGGGCAGAGNEDAGDVRSPYVVALDTVMSRLESVEEKLRRAEVERVMALADAFDVLTVETGTAYGSVPSGATGEIAYRALRAEIAAVTGVTERTAEQQLCHAVQLRHNYRGSCDALAEGRISYRHTTVIVDAGAIIGSRDDIDAVGRRAGYEEAVLPYAMTETPARLVPIARRLAEQFAEHSLEERHEDARECRRVWVVPQPDGMADVVAHVPATEAYGIVDRLTRIARRMERAERKQHGECGKDGTSDSVQGRTRDQLRADVFAELVLTGTLPDGTAVGGTNGADSTADIGSIGGVFTGPNRVVAQVQVVVPVEVLGPEAVAALTHRSPPGNWRPTDTGDPPPFGAPALLSGYGAIDECSANKLASRADHWEIVRMDVASGVILAVDRYRPSEAMRRYLTARDQRCRFVGCSVPAVRCEIDHTVDAAGGGPTAISNLEHLCRSHHTLKHHSGWKVRQLEHGVLEWTTPTGRTRIDRPPGTATLGIPTTAPCEPPAKHPF